MKLFIRTLGILVFVSPAVAFAQSITNAQNLFTLALNILNGYVVPIIFALAFIMFLWGVYRYFIAGGADSEKVKDGQKFVLWSVIGFVLMFSIWGIINLMINSLGFDVSDRPAFPTFPTFGSSSYTTGSNLNSIFSGLFGNTTTNGTTGGLTAGQTFVDPVTGQTFTATGANTYNPVPGTTNCGTTGTYNGITCVKNSSTNGNGTGGTGAVGNGSQGAACTTNTQCTDPDECDASTDSCQPPGPNSYSCADDSAANENTGLCANGQPARNSNGDEEPASDYTGSVAQGGDCTRNTQCGNGLACDAATDSCQPDGTNTYSCADDSVANEQTGLCANGQPAENSNGDEEGAGGNGEVGTGGSCASNPNICANGTECNNGTCVAIPADGAAGNGQSCLGNENACQDGYTCNNDTDTCTPDSSVDNSNTTVNCNDGSTQDQDVGCANDCGVVGSTDTCNDSSGTVDTSGGGGTDDNSQYGTGDPSSAFGDDSGDN